MNAKNDLFFFLFILFVIGVAWFLTGGPEKLSSRNPFLSPPPPLGTGETYGSGTDLFSFLKGNGRQTSSTSTVSKTPGATSAFSGNATLRSSSAKAAKPAEEYLTIEIKGQAVDITGWRLKSQITGREATIGKGAALAYSAQVNPESNIVLQSGEKAIVITGPSPIGVSFRLNKCTGYFSQFQKFTPSLPKHCPTPEEELDLFGPRNLPDSCIDFIERAPRCQVVISMPTTLSPECIPFITEKLNYNQCVSAHRADSDFIEHEWHIYLNRNEELWKIQREAIDLIDASGKVVSTISY